MLGRDKTMIYKVNCKHYTIRGNQYNKEEIMQTLKLTITTDDDCLKIGDKIIITDLEKPMKKDFCSRCGRSRPVAIIRLGKPICQACLTSVERIE